MIVDPPKRAQQFLSWFCPSYLHEGIEGDLLEQFDLDVEELGSKKANRRFWWNVFRFFRFAILKRNNNKLKINYTIMLGNYFKITTRSMMKSKLYTFINAFGLSIGIAFCMLIYLYIQDDRSFDKFHSNVNEIYRIECYRYSDWFMGERDDDPFEKMAHLQKAVGPTLKEEIEEVELATRYNSGSDGTVRYGDKVFTESLTYVDRDFFQMFSFELYEGDKASIFSDPLEVVITQEIAEKYFGNSDPINQVLEIDREGAKSYKVTGIIAKAPSNSSLDYDILINQVNRSYYDRQMENWRNYNTPVFIKLADNTDFEALGYKLDQIVEKYMGEYLANMEIPEEIKSQDGFKPFEFQYTNLADIHLDTSVSWHKSSDPQYSLILGAIAVLILIIACINYVSLALTTSASRRVEVGVRKAIGAQSSQIVYQFTFESMLLAMTSMIIGLGLMYFFLPWFNEFTSKGILLNGNTVLHLLGFGVMVAIVVGIIAGSYPSLVLSGFKPAKVLKGRSSAKINSGFTRPLVITQYAMSAFLIISSIIMYQQMEYVTTKDLGFDKEQVLVIPTQAGWNEKSDKTVSSMRRALSQHSNIINVAGTSSSFNQGFSLNGYEIDGQQHSAFTYRVDPQYASLLGLEFVNGRNFDPDMLLDSTGVLVNEALVKDMDWEYPIEEHLNWQEDTVGLGAKVIGVIKDYHFRSLESEIQPMLLTMANGRMINVLVKIKAENISETIATIKDEWKALYPDRPFDYSFMDEDIDRQYQSYSRWMKIMGLATGFAILISCLGLFGLSGVSAVNRTKEIGIRKVMGAELSNIFVLLNKQYIWLALIAFVVASPLSWYVMNIWLDDFQFAISIGWEVFALSIVVGLMVALSTVSYHAIKTALVNPAETLKYE